MRLIFVNVAVFLAVILVGTIAFLMQWQFDVLNYLGAFSGFIDFIKKPWTAVTYMFTHEGFFHLFFNMLILYFLGRIFQDLLGEKRLLGVYLWGGLAGFLMYISFYNLFPAFEGLAQHSRLHGASASVMAVVFGISAYSPNYRISLFLPQFVVKLWWIAAFYFVTDIIAIQGMNSGGSLAHLGGALFGILFATQLKKGNDMATGLGEWVSNLRTIGKRKPKLRVEKKPDKSGKRKAQSTMDASEDTQVKVDRILDKISKSGYDSLSKAERDFLFKASKND